MYERLVSDGALILQLHHRDVGHHHGPIGDPGGGPFGNGVLLWFEVNDFDAAIERAAEMKAEVVLAPHRNPPDSDERPEPPGMLAARSRRVRRRDRQPRRRGGAVPGRLIAADDGHRSGRSRIIYSHQERGLRTTGDPEMPSGPPRTFGRGLGSNPMSPPIRHPAEGRDDLLRP